MKSHLIMFKSRRNNSYSEVKWENWKRIPTRSSQRVKNQELVRKINRKQSASNPYKSNVLELKPKKLLASSSERKWPIQPKSKRTTNSYMRKDSDSSISLSNDLSLNDYIQRHSITKLSLIHI